MSSPAPQFEGINSMAFCLLYGPALTTVHNHWEDYSLDHTDLCWQSNVSAFQHTVYVCHRFPVEKQNLLISWLQSLSAVILEPKKRKSVTASSLFPSICHAVMGPDAMILVLFFLIVLSQLFHSSPSLSSRDSLVPLRFLSLEWIIFITDKNLFLLIEGYTSLSREL